MRVAVLGRTHWLIEAADRCLLRGHEITLVATAPAAPEYRAREEDFKALADRARAQFHVDPDLNDTNFIRLLKTSGAEIGLSINWPTIIRQGALASLRLGILNAHVGDLPRYRGNACPNWAILNGEPHIGMCIHAMSPNSVDSGPIYARRRLPIDVSVYIADVYGWIDQTLPDLIMEALNNAI